MPVDEEAAAQRDESLKDHLIIVGFGVGGKHLARTAREAGIPYVILEMNPDTLFLPAGFVTAASSLISRFHPLRHCKSRIWICPALSNGAVLHAPCL